MSVIDEIAAERARQVSGEGWTPEHDDQHKDGSMAAAACSYAGIASLGLRDGTDTAQHEPTFGFWPWSREWWKPTTPRRDLIKAAALIVAQIEQIDRAAAKAA